MEGHGCTFQPLSLGWVWVGLLCLGDQPSASDSPGVLPVTMGADMASVSHEHPGGSLDITSHLMQGSSQPPRVLPLFLVTPGPVAPWAFICCRRKAEDLGRAKDLGRVLPLSGWVARWTLLSVPPEVLGWDSVKSAILFKAFQETLKFKVIFARMGRDYFSSQCTMAHDGVLYW